MEPNKTLKRPSASRNVMTCLCPTCNGRVWRCERRNPVTPTASDYDLTGLTVEERCLVFLYSIGRDITGYFDGRLSLGHKVASEDMWEESAIWEEDGRWSLPLDTSNFRDWEKSAAERAYLSGE